MSHESGIDVVVLLKQQPETVVVSALCQMSFTTIDELKQLCLSSSMSDSRIHRWMVKQRRCNGEVLIVNPGK